MTGMARHDMDSPAAIDVLMPFRNAADTLPACLESIAAQTLSDWRLVAVDDGSTDASRALVEAFARRTGRVLILSSDGAGLVPALNLGLSACTAPLVARMDADDTMAPERLALQAALLERTPALGLAAGLVHEADHSDGFRHYVAWSNGLVSHDAIAGARFVESPIVHPTVCFRRELVARHGGYRDGDFPEDYELWLRWLEAGVRFAKVDRTVLTWRDHGARLTRTDRRYGIDQFFAVKAGYLARWLEKHSPHGKRVWIWGAGYETRRRIRVLKDHGIAIEAFIDIDPRKVGTRNQDGRVFGPDALPPPEACCVLAAVGTRGARELISRALREKGFIEGRSFLCVA